MAATPQVPPGLSDLSGSDALRRAMGLFLSMGVEQQRKDPGRAAECFRQVVDLARSLGDEAEEGRSLLLCGTVESQRGRLPEAEPLLERALSLARIGPDGLRVASCLNALGQLRLRQGRSEEGLAHLRESLARTTERAGEPAAAPVRADTLEHLGTAYAHKGDTDHALRYFEEGLELRRAAEDGAGLARVLNQLGNLRHRMGQYHEAISCYRQSLERLRQLEETRGAAGTANNLASTLMRLGELDEARQLFEESRQRFESLGEVGRAADVLSNLGLLAQGQGRAEEAEIHYLESLRLRRGLGDPLGETNSLTNLSHLAVARGRCEEAIRFAEESLALLERTGLKSTLAPPLVCKGLALLELGRFPEAAGMAEEARRAAEQAHAADQLSEALTLRARVHQEEGDLDEALRDALEARRLAEETEDPELLAAACRCLGSILLGRGELEEAKQALTLAARSLRGWDHSFERARISFEEGMLLARVGAQEAGAERLRRAEREFARFGNARWRLASLARLAQVLEASDPAQAEASHTAARALAEAHGLSAYLEGALRATGVRPDPGSPSPGFDQGPPEVRAAKALHSLAGSFLEAASLRSGEAAPYLDPLFAFLRRELGAARAWVRLEREPALRWVRRGEQRAGTLPAVRPGEPSESVCGPAPAVFAFPSGARDPAAAPGAAGAPDAGAASGSAGASDSAAASGSAGTPGPTGAPDPGPTGGAPAGSASVTRLEMSLGPPGADYGCLVLERDGGAEFTPAERQICATAGRILSLALEVEFERSDHLGLPEDVELERGRFESLVGSSRPMQEIYRLIAQAAPTDSTVLILGESGTGKELVARSVHARSRRSQGPFIAINCPSIPKDLLESELFGHERGAFTGAVATVPGKIEMANGGTLFLDEIGDMPQATQAKLLRFLQEREFERVGGRKSLRVDVRVCAATSRDLAEAMERGEFREDLYYRLNVVPMHVPGLRERREDIPLLVEHFLRLLPAGESGRPRRVAAGALDGLLAHDWPGNVRELRNTVEYMTALCSGDVLEHQHLPPALRNRAAREGTPGERARPNSTEAGGGLSTSEIRPGETLESRLMQVEAALIRATLEAVEWNQSAAARRLGVTETKVRNRMKQYGIRRPSDG